MKHLLMSITIIMLMILFFQACTTVEDPGPLQEISKDFTLYDFDQLEIGDGFNIDVVYAETFEINIRGDQRNLNDVEVFKAGTTLIIKYKEFSGRRHQTYITIKMPELNSVNFSGGSISSVSGFNSDKKLDFYLSGGSVSQFSAGIRSINLTLTGGSILRLRGLGDELNASISGASELTAVDYPVSTASVYISGASNAKLKVSEELNVNASGASVLFYSGNPTIQKDVSGGSSVLPY
jgi:hypothetical protein